MQVLVVEDEKRLAQALAQILKEEKYLVDVAYTGSDGLNYGLSGIYDVIVLDVMLPGLSGFEIAAQLRREKINSAILMLTARDAVPDRVAGLDSGADDYMTKPFAPEELLARVRALTRRHGEVVLREMTYADLTLDLSTGDLTCGGKAVRLNFKEFAVMQLLLAAPGTVVPKETLLVKVWGYESGAEDNNVEAYISFLRKKLAFLGSRVNITALRRLGYQITERRE